MPHAQIILKFLHVTHVAIKDSKQAVLQNRLARKSFKGRMSLQALAFRIFGRPPVMKQGLEASDNAGPQHVQGTFSSDALRKREDPKVVLHPGLARQQAIHGRSMSPGSRCFGKLLHHCGTAKGCISPSNFCVTSDGFAIEGPGLVSP